MRDFAMDVELDLDWWNEFLSDSEDTLIQLSENEEEDCDSCEIGEDIVNDFEDDFHSFQSDRESSDCSDTEELSPSSFELGKDGITSWKILSPLSDNTDIRTPDNSCNKATSCDQGKEDNLETIPGDNLGSGVRGQAATNSKTILNCWRLFFTNEIVEKIVYYTNIYLARIRLKYLRARDATETDSNEIMALFGLLYSAGIMKAAHMNLRDLWDDTCGPPIFRNVMSKKRFYILLEALHFDDIRDRSQRKSSDQLAPIREIFDNFNRNCMNHYRIGQSATINEIMLPFKGKCSFKHYIKSRDSKTKRSGIKIYALADSTSSYTSKMEIWVGNQPEGPFKQDLSRSSLIKRIVEPIAHTNRNVICDKFFTTIPLAVDLLQNFKTTLVGCIRKNKPEVPRIFTMNSGRKTFSSMCGSSKNCMLVSYVPKRRKNLLILSTKHRSFNLISSRNSSIRIPEAVQFYLKSGGGVNILNKLLNQYTISRISTRWCLTIFFALANIAGLNSHIIYTGNIKEQPSLMMSRSKFLKTLSLDLVKNHLVRRLSIKHLSPLLQMQIRLQLKLEPQRPYPEPHEDSKMSTEENGNSRNNARNKCAFCPKRKNRKTLMRCQKPTCSLPICGEHMRKLCIKCWDHEEESEQ